MSEAGFFGVAEQSGNAAGKIKFPELAAALGLNGAKLEGIAKGWLPSPKDLSVWRELRHISTTQNGTEVHSYLVWDEVTREAALFDTGWDVASVLKIVEEEQLQLKHLFITHSHPDHIAGMAKIKEVLPKIFLHMDSKSAFTAAQEPLMATILHLTSAACAFCHESRDARARGGRRDLRGGQLRSGGRAVCGDCR